MSFQDIQHPTNYSDYLSLKLHAERQKGSEKVNLLRTFRTQTGTAGAVEVEEKAAATIAHVGKAGLTLVMACDTNNNAYDTQTVYIRYITPTGTKGYCYATFDSGDSTTEVAFYDVATGLVAVTDFYMPDPDYSTLAVICSVAVVAGHNVCIGITGCVAGIADPNLCYILILAAATSPTLANMHGVGSLWGRAATNHNDTDGAILTIDYWTPWGSTVEGALCTINTTNGETETKFLKSDGVMYVMDYYRTKKIHTNICGTTNSHEFRICDFDCAAIYGVIEELLYTSIHTRAMALGAAYGQTWLGKITITNSTASVVLALTLTPKNAPAAITINKTIPAALAVPYTWDLPIQTPLEPLSECSMTIIGNTAIFDCDVIYVEAVV